ncbi:SgcJ/EcaC family oxidoreductase [Kiritimatiellaeota bacterium B1221]|nr:SgcJ/EcaC family oxidoreductase [Kiritimatiellaeota bacterium B1221]
MPFVKYVTYPGILMLLCLCACTSPADPSQAPSNTEEHKVRDLLHLYLEGRQERDTEAVKTLLDPEMDQLTSRGEWRRGRDAALSGMKRSSTRNPGDRSIHVESVRFLDPEVALIDARYTIKGVDGPDRILWSSFTLVKNPRGEWRITSIRNQKPAE